MNVSPFHLAIPVRDLMAMRHFYVEVLGCSTGRSDKHWIDLDLYGHQLVLHQVEGESLAPDSQTNPVDGHDVPVPHFGVVLSWDTWQELAARLEAHGVEFLIAPYVRFEGEVGEQATLFFLDPEGNALEFKSFRDMAQLFATD